MKLNVILAAAAVILIGFSRSVLADPSPKCDGDLIQDVETSSSSVALNTALFQLVTRDTYESAKKSAALSAFVPSGIFGANYDEFQINRSKYLNEVKFNLDYAQSQTYARRFLSHESVEAIKRAWNQRPALRMGYMSGRKI